MFNLFRRPILGRTYALEVQIKHIRRCD